MMNNYFQNKRIKMIKRNVLLTTLLSFMVVGLFGAFIPNTIYANELSLVYFTDADGTLSTCTNYTELSSTTQTLYTGWYVAKNTVSITNCVVSGDVKIILLDGCNLLCTGESNQPGISVSSGANTLTIFAGNITSTIKSTGILNAIGGNGGAGIGGGKTVTGNNITINGGTIIATGNGGGAGIGGGVNDGSTVASGNNITINDGTVIATGNDGGAGIGGGNFAFGSNIMLNGGKVTATGGTGASGIGGGNMGSASNIYALDNIQIKAGASENPETVITHTSSLDIANDLAGKRYVSAEIIREAKIGDKYYEKFTDAIAAVNADETITLLKNIELSSSLSINKDKNFILDLNGFTIKGSVTNYGKISVINSNTEYTVEGNWILKDDSETSLDKLVNKHSTGSISGSAVLSGTIYVPSGIFDIRGCDATIRANTFKGGTSSNPKKIDTLKATRVYFGETDSKIIEFSVGTIILENYKNSNRTALGVYNDTLIVDEIKVDAETKDWYWNQQYQPYNYQIFTGAGGKLSIQKSLTTGEFVNATFNTGNIGATELADGAVVNCVDFQNTGNLTDDTKAKGTAHVIGSGATLNTAVLLNHAITDLGTVNITMHPGLFSAKSISVYNVNYGTGAVLTIGTLNFKNIEGDTTKHQLRIGDDAKTIIGGLSSSPIGAGFYVTGTSDSSINKDGGNKVCYTGDIVFTKYKNSDINDTKFSLNLDSSDDYFTGSIQGTSSTSNRWGKWSSAIMGNETPNNDIKGMTLTMSNGSKWNITKDSIVNTLNISGSTINGGHALTVKDSMSINGAAQISVSDFTNSGTIKVDMTGITANNVKLIDCSGTGTYGTYQFEEGKDNGYELLVSNNDLIAKIKPKDIVGCTVDAIPNEVYTGSSIVPEITIKDGTTELVKNVDYVDSFTDNINAGVAVITIVGKNKYTGVKTVSFTIDKKEVSLTSASAQKEYDGTPLADNTITANGFVGEEGAVYNVTGSQTEIGTSKNTFTYSLKQNTSANNYSIITIEGDLTVTKKAGPVAPTGLKGIAPVTRDGFDGKVTGVTDKMEYRINNGEWADCSGNEITGLSACKVHVRVKETNDTQAGEIAEVTVGPYIGFNVTFNFDGKGINKTVEVASGSTATRPEQDPTYTRWIFIDWFKQGMEELFDFTDKILKNTTIYALWEKEVYTATFDANGGSGSMEDMDTVDWKLTLPTNGFTAPAGYQFAGWGVDSKMGEAKAPGTEVEFIMDTTIYALWETIPKPTPPVAEEYLAAFDSNGGTGIMNNMETVDKKITLPENEFTAPSGYKFAGWGINSKTGNPIAAGTIVSLLNNSTIFAIWEEIVIIETHIISFDMQGHGVQIAPVTVKSGDKVQKPTDPIANGYTFYGWCNKDMKTLYNFDSAVTKDITLFAKWIQNYRPDEDSSDTHSSKPVKTGTWGDPVTDGNWTQSADGKWSYKTNAPFRSTWGYIRNPYAKKGQPKDGWFYFDANGNMLTGWHLINGKWYFLNTMSDGTFGMCLLDTITPDGYIVDRDGVWTGKKK